ncbi:MAG TPA: hypothetical protein VLO11_08050 [Luteolibacter sp.]|nr:hypothetical protein [Luteolibacter sp.]
MNPASFTRLVRKCRPAIPAAALFSILPHAGHSQTWQDITAHTGATALTADRGTIAAVGSRLYVVGGPSGKGVLVSEDGGQTFTAINTVVGAAYNLADANTMTTLRFANGRLWVSTSSPDAAFNYLHWLTPGDTEWQQGSISGFPPPVQLNSFGVIDDVVWDATTGLYYCVAQLGGVWVSADGQTWEQRTSGFGGSGAPASLAAVDGTVFALRPLSGLRRSTDAGLSWSANSPHQGVDGGHLRRTGDKVSFQVVGDFSQTINYMTPDKGETWVTVTGLPPGMFNRLSGDGELLFTATATGRLLVSPDAGLSWQDLPTDGLQLNFPVWPETDPTGVFEPSRIERLGDALFVIGNEYIDAFYTKAPKLYRLDIASLSFPKPFGIYLQPQSRGLLVGQSHELKVYADGNNVSYQWRKNGADIPGATSRTLLLDNVQLAAAGDYDCVISHDDGPDVPSSVATIAVFAREDGRWDPVFDQTDVSAGGRVHLLENSEAIVVKPTSNPLTIYRIGADGGRLQNDTTTTTTSSNNVNARSLLDANGNIVVSLKPNSNTTQLQRYNSSTFDFESSVGIGSSNSSSLRIQDLVEVPGRGYAIVGGFDRTSHMGVQVTVKNFALINYDFTTDANFPGGTGPNVSSAQTSVTCAPDGSIYVAGGGFSSWSGVATPRSLVRIDPAGTVHAVNTGIAGTSTASFVHALDDGRILVLFDTSGARQLHALQPNGTVDSTFNTAGHTITDIARVAQQADGKIILIGDFSSFGGTTAAGYIRLNTDGTVDDTFYTATGFSHGTVNDVAYDPRGYIYLSTTTNSTSFQGQAIPTGRGPVRIFATPAEPGGGDNTFADWPALLDLPENQRGPLDTPAGDGVPNLVKFAVGVGPLESAAGRIPQEVLESTVNDESYPTVCFVRDTTAVGVTLQIEVAADLDFTTVLGSTVVSTQDLGNGLEQICVRSNVRFADATKQFFRITVSGE